MRGQRSSAENQVAELLRTAMDSLGMSVSFLSRLEGDTQHFEVVESRVPVPIEDGSSGPRRAGLCHSVLERRLPAIIPDVTALPPSDAGLAAGIPGMRSYLAVPLVFSDGRVYGTFCAVGFEPDPTLTERDRMLLKVLARAAATIIEPEVRERERKGEIRGRVEQVLTAGGPVVLLQPIVALATGVRVGAEALSRFPEEWGKPPDVVFAEAHTIQRGAELEVSALRRASETLAQVSGYVAMNVSPATMLDPVCAQLLAELPADRIVLELSEHNPVEDYPRLMAALAPLRAAGVQLSIDDVGAGYSSLRHIVMTSPDVIKLDRGIVAGVATDRVLATLVRALVTFAAGCGAQVVAEGIETAQDAVELADLGVGFGQGWYFGRPMKPSSLAEPVGVPVPPEPRAWVVPGTRGPQLDVDRYPQPWEVVG